MSYGYPAHTNLVGSGGYEGQRIRKKRRRRERRLAPEVQAACSGTDRALFLISPHLAMRVAATFSGTRYGTFGHGAVTRAYPQM